MPEISVIIRAKNEEAAIGKTLESLSSQNSFLPFEVIVVDSGSTDRTVSIAESFNVRLLRMPPEIFSYGRALNRAISEARGSILCNLSAHCIPVTGRWLEALTAPIVQGAAQASFGRQVAVQGLNPWEEFYLETLFPPGGLCEGRVPFSNANCAFSREMWEKQKFDEELPRWEDYLWYLLAKDRYDFFYVPEASVRHSHPFSAQWIETMSFKDGRAAALIAKKYGIDIHGGKTSSVFSKIDLLLRDGIETARFFIRKGYWKPLLEIPRTKIRGYSAYWKGYRSVP